MYFHMLALFVFGGSQPGVLLKKIIESGFGIKSAIIGDGDNGVMVEIAAFKLSYHRFQAVFIHVREKIFPDVDVKEFGQLIFG